MPKNRYAKTEWGLKVTLFSHRLGIPYTEIAKSAGVPLSTLEQVMIGKTAGHIVIPAVEAFMAAHDALPRRCPTPVRVEGGDQHDQP